MTMVMVEAITLVNTGLVDIELVYVNGMGWDGMK